MYLSIKLNVQIKYKYYSVSKYLGESEYSAIFLKMISILIIFPEYHKT